MTVDQLRGAEPGTSVGEEHSSSTLVIRNASLLGRDGHWDLTVSGGTITEITAEAGKLNAREIDASGGLVTRSFVEPHFHPDKALTRPLVGEPAGDDLATKMQRGAEIKRGYTFDEVKARASAALRLAVSHGVGAMRAQVDVDSVCGLVGIEALLELRTEFSELLDLQLVAFPQEGIVRDPDAVELLAEALTMGADLVGGGPNNEDSAADWQPHLAAILGLAQQFGVPADIHVDFREDPDQRALELLAEMTLAHGLKGRVNASHCCALAAYPDPHARQVIEEVRRAGIQVCICPMSNLLIPTGTKTERGRNASRPKELLEAGVNVAAGSDNMNDMWFRFGRLDPVELGLLTCLSVGMRTDAEVLEAFAMTTTRAAAYAYLPTGGTIVGADADLVVFSVSTLDDVLRNVEGRRLTLKRGRVVGGSESRTWLEPTG